MTLPAETLDAVVVPRPAPTPEHPQHLAADKGFDYPECHADAEARGYTPHIRSRGEEKREKETIPGYRARRWVVEVCHSQTRRENLG
jgi:putative transposase